MLKHWLLALNGVVIVAARLRGVHPRRVVIRMLRVGHKCVGVAPLFEEPSCLFGLEGLAVYRLDAPRLLVGQCAELLSAGAPR
jgi:hypothetical protein